MFCTKCGNKLNNNEKFCSKCGNKTSGLSFFEGVNKYLFQTPLQNTYDKTKYTIFETFSHTSPLDPASHFTITDCSLIYINTEYLFSQLTVIAIPKEDLITQRPSTTIDGEEVVLGITKEDRPRFWVAAMHANEKIKLNSLKEKVQYALSLENCCSNLLFHRFRSEDFSIALALNDYIAQTGQEESSSNLGETIDESKIQGLLPILQKFAEEYKYAKEILRSFYNENNIAPKEYLSSRGLAKIIDYIEENDTDTNAAIEKYLEAKRQEALELQRRREENIARREAGLEEPSSGGSGILSGVLKTAAGVALGNKMSGGHRGNSKRSGAPDLMGTSACMYGKRKNGWIVHCDVSCPVYSRCSRGGGR